MASAQPNTLDCAIDLMRRLPPRNVVDNLALLTALRPDLEDEILSSVDQPLRSMRCPLTSRDFLVCDYNRDGDSYRSPYANEYTPALENPVLPSEQLRILEVAANSAFDAYREQYFEGGLSSTYLWDLDSGFAGVILFQKKIDDHKEAYSGTWDSIHIFEVAPPAANKKSATYKLTSTIMLYLVKGDSVAQTQQMLPASPLSATPNFAYNNSSSSSSSTSSSTSSNGSLPYNPSKPNNTALPSNGDLDLCGSITRQTKKELPLDNANTHLTNMGTLVEAMENQMREILTSVYFERSRDVVSRLRTRMPIVGPTGGATSLSQTEQVRSELLNRLAMTGRKLP